MLIKVKDVDGKWVLFDNAEEVHYDTTQEEFTSKRDLGFLVGPEEQVSLTIVLPNVDLDSIDDDHPLKVGIIKFIRQSKRYMVVFNTLCYICNDQGKTVEKVAISDGN